ncbi:hypothetical protein A8L34_09685 [Bacillus sp. FJAT-27264]|uniref:hypothetical protein n=1 Tax=Paenibacillus sp. (strain DSM 101736 / FJAT-27264) TaxID=1850362 RepID=UPI000807B194|nr:hypothetical protein [Bacillus sp. FJAT-27264]OBZ14220.1 hypothetical protein A8L34_09685 [Bacillus sp. FJAT-27264]
MNNKTLLMADPVLRSYPMYAHTLSIVANNPSYLGWFYSNYIQISCSKFRGESNSFQVNYHNQHERYFCPWIHYNRLNKEFVTSKWNGDIVQFLIDIIDQSFYVYFVVDNYYIPASWSYHKVSHPHDLLVYGYDLKEKTFNIADAFVDGKYSHATCTFSEMEAAYTAYDQPSDIYRAFNNNIELLRLNTTDEVDPYLALFNLPFVEDSLRNFLTGNDLSPGMKPIFENYSMGIHVYDDLMKYLDYVKDNEATYIDLRGIYVISEHKKIMLSRIEYMLEHKYIHFDKKLLTDYKDVLKEAILTLNVAIKYNIKPDQILLSKIHTGVEKMRNREMDVLSEFLTK